MGKDRTDIGSVKRWCHELLLDSEVSIELFPEVKGSNLLGEKLTIPKDLWAALNIVVIAFQRWHQRLVDTWVPFLKKLVGRYTDIDYYELPTIRKMNPVSRMFIDGGMRAGVPSQDTRKRTITLYIDKQPFKDSLGIGDESDIHVFLIRNTGEILFHESGEFLEQKGTSLQDTIEDLLKA